MAKPSGSVCNIDCEYCFYLEKDLLYPERQKNWRMSDATLEQFIKQQIDAQSGSTVDIAWQGGEPTLLGLEFFEKAVAFCDAYRGDKVVRHAFQTNGILIDDRWCAFFNKHHFLVGISIDGPKNLHDYYRKTRSGKGTHAKIIETINRLKTHQVEFNTLTVISSANVKHPRKVYQYLKALGSQFIQFIPLVERHEINTDGNNSVLAGPNEPLATVTKWSVNAKEYGSFLTTIFDLWIQEDVGRVFVQNFDSTLASWLDEPAGVCIFSEQCGHAFALESNGDLYQCDHYVYPEYLLGNIHEQSISELNNSPEAIQFGLDKSATLNAQCQSCQFKFACNGGCPKQRFERGPSGKPDHNYLCEGYYAYFQHVEKDMTIMAALLRNQRPASDIMAFKSQKIVNTPRSRAKQKIGRNSLCPCHSGRKYKACCGNL
jgi:uncharacterized protein